MIVTDSNNDLRNEIIRIKQNIKALKTSGHFNDKEQADLLQIYKAQLKKLGHTDLLDIEVIAPQIVQTY